jgi:hypothetical protein
VATVFSVILEVLPGEGRKDTYLGDAQELAVS